MDLTLLATLKDKLATTDRFAAVMEYFFDHFGDDPEFIDQGERADCPFLETILAQVGAQLCGKPVTPADVLLTRLPEHQFVHGRCFLDGKLTTVLYFEDIHLGLLAVVWSFASGDTKLVRFRGRALSGPSREPSPN
jgi:hypothetical protein